MVMPGSRSVSGATGWRLSSDWYSSSPWRWIFCGSMGCPVKGKSGAVGLGQEVADEAHETVRVFELRPVAAVAENLQLAVGNPLPETSRVLQRDDLVFPPVHDQRLVRQRADGRLGAGHRIDPALARRREHGGERCLETGPDAGPVAQLRQFVGDQRASVG